MSSAEFFSLLRWLDGRPLLDHIEPYRLRIFEGAFDTFDESGRPRFNLILSGRAKKNWKSADLVLAGLYALLANDSPGGNQCYVLANDEGQAGDDLALAKKLVRCNPPPASRLSLAQKTITRRDGNGVLEILPAQDVAGSHGKTYRLCAFDIWPTWCRERGRRRHDGRPERHPMNRRGRRPAALDPPPPVPHFPEWTAERPSPRVGEAGIRALAALGPTDGLAHLERWRAWLADRAPILLAGHRATDWSAMDGHALVLYALHGEDCAGRRAGSRPVAPTSTASTGVLQLLAGALATQVDEPTLARAMTALYGYSAAWAEIGRRAHARDSVTDLLTARARGVRAAWEVFTLRRRADGDEPDRRLEWEENAMLAGFAARFQSIMGGNPEDAENLTPPKDRALNQLVATLIHRYAHNPKVNPLNLLGHALDGYLDQIDVQVRQQVRDKARGPRRMVVGAEPNPQTAAWWTALPSNPERWESVLQQLEHLLPDPEDREILRRSLAGETQAQIAVALGRSQSWVSQRLAWIRGTLRPLLE